MTKPIQIKNLTIGAGIPKICVPLTGTTREKICQEAEDAKKAAADLVEWRADFFEELMNPEACQNVLEALAEILGETPLLFTIRTSEEGGNITISLEDYAACNINIAKGKKADLVDVEVKSNSEEKKKLVQVTKECVELGLAEVKPWGFLGDVGAAVCEHAHANGYTVVREIGGHGIGLEFHEEPWVGYNTRRGEEMLLVPGMMFTIEPMVNMGTQQIYTDQENGWEVYTLDGKPSAQWEYQVLVTEEGAEVISW